jgi:hypothetical protein
LVKNKHSENVTTPGILSAALNPTASLWCLSANPERDDPPNPGVDALSSSEDAMEDIDSPPPAADVNAILSSLISPPSWCDDVSCGDACPASSGSTTKNKLITRPLTAIKMPGIINDIPQFESLKHLAAINDPRMFPTDVCAFHIPMIKPLLLFPNQFPTTDTTEGHPVD